MYLWKPKDVAAVKVALSSTITITAAAALDTFFTGTTETYDQLQAYMKDITVAVPEGSIELMNFLGVDSNYVQNTALDEKPYTLAGISGTITIPKTNAGGVTSNDSDIETVEKFFFGDSTDIPTSSPTHLRYQPAKLSSTGRKEISILVTFNNGQSGDNEREINVVLDKAKITKLGDIKMTGADGNLEVEFNAVCRPNDFMYEVSKTD